MKAIYYIELPIPYLRAHCHRSDNLAAALQILQVAPLIPITEIYQHDEDVLGLKITITTPHHRLLYNHISEINHLYPRGILTRNQDATFTLPGYELIPYISNTFKPKKIKLPKPIKIKIPKRKRGKVPPRPPTDYGPCPYCGLRTLINPMFILKPHSHIAQCKARHTDK